MNTVQVAIGPDVFDYLEVPCCTVGLWKRTLTKGFLGEEVPFAKELVCRAGGGEKLLQDSSRLPSLPERLHVDGPSAVLRILHRALSHKLGPPVGTTHGQSLEAEQERLLQGALSPWEEVCLAVGGTTAGILYPADAPAQFESARRARRVLWLAGYPRPRRGMQERAALQWLRERSMHSSDSSTEAEDNSAEHQELNYSSLHNGEQVRCWVVQSRIGHGHVGDVFRVRRMQQGTESPQNAALKWTLESRELGVWKAIQRGAPGTPGLPELLDSGVHRGQQYAVMQFLGRDLRWLLPHLRCRSQRQRWLAVRVLGRMLLRRLKAVHGCGFVHCDVSPYNVLFGCTQSDYDVERAHDEDSHDYGEGPALVPYLIDFGIARPQGQPLGAEHGTLEFTSARTVGGGPRLPEDDLEALGWVMAFLVLGDLPWLQWEATFEEEVRTRNTPDSTKQRMHADVVQRVWQAKCEVLCGHKLDLPAELYAYMQACSWAEPAPSDPDYQLLMGLLGGRPGLSMEEAEMEDLRECRTQVAALL